MLIYEVYDPVSSETLARKATLEKAQQYVTDMFAEEGDPPPMWRENVPGEWWALSPDGSSAEYIIFAETVD